MGNKVVDIARVGKLLPPAPDLCQSCATKHEPELPHNFESLFWQYWYYNQHGRWPTTADAFAHCTPEMRARWVQAMRLKRDDLAMSKKKAERDAVPRCNKLILDIEAMHG